MLFWIKIYFKIYTNPLFIKLLEISNWQKRSPPKIMNE